jgi:hypothetical protein
MIKEKRVRSVKDQIIATQKAKIEELQAQNDFLQHENDRQRRMINGLKLNNSRLTLERNELNAKLQNMTIFDLSEEAQEQAGHLLAKSLLGGK